MQLDETTDISSECQVVCFARYVWDEDIEEQILFSEVLQTNATGEALYLLLDSFIQRHSLQWQWCTAICTDGAASMSGCSKGFITHAKRMHPNIEWTHCLIHREALVAKFINHSLEKVLKDAIAIINYIKSSALRTRLFKKLCEDVAGDERHLLYHVDVRWLSKGKMLQRLFSLRNEVKAFLAQMKQEEAMLFQDPLWVMRLSYLADIFDKLNDLNLSLQGPQTNIVFMHTKISAFICKISFWIDLCNENDSASFPSLAAIINSKEYLLQSSDIESVFADAKEHLQLMQQQFRRYFPDSREIAQQLAWIRNPFAVTNFSLYSLTAAEREQFIEMVSDETLKLKLNSSSVTKFWISVRDEFPAIANKAINKLLPFGSTYLCESSFSALAIIKSKPRNKLTVANDLIVSVSSVSPCLTRLASKKQAHPSH